MISRSKSHFAILGIIASLLFFGDVRAEEGPPSDHAAGQEMVTGPEQHPKRLVSLDPWVVEDEILGTARRSSIAFAGFARWRCPYRKRILHFSRPSEEK